MLTRREIEPYIKQGYIRKQICPDIPFLTIYNYTKQTEYEGYWNPITKACRGLVLDDKNRIIVNCPPKFFNQGEPYAPKFKGEYYFLEKRDGYFVSITKDALYGLVVTSRGSFDNKYVSAVNKFLTPRIINALPTGLTYFCELCQDFPEDFSIIVTRYSAPELVCWAVRDQSGKEYFPFKKVPIPFPTVKIFSKPELKDYLKQEVEGVVAFNGTERIKLKTDWYFNQHKLISHFSKRKIWEILKSGQTIADSNLPDEFIPQAIRWAQEIEKDFNRFWGEIQLADSETSHLTDKELGLLDKYQPIKKYLFMLRKDQEQAVLNKIWDEVKPKYDTID